jgi:hypothetical protein
MLIFVATLIGCLIVGVDMPPIASEDLTTGLRKAPAVKKAHANHHSIRRVLVWLLDGA